MLGCKERIQKNLTLSKGCYQASSFFRLVAIVHGTTKFFPTPPPRITKLSYNILVLLSLIGIIFLSSCYQSNLGGARAAMDMGSWDQALIILLQESRRNPRDAEAHYLLGETYYHLDQIASMKENFDKSLRINGQFKRRIDYYTERCFIEKSNAAQDILLRNPPDYEQAVEFFKEALILKPDNFEVARSLALCYDALDLVDTAISILEELVSANPNDITSLDRLAAGYYKQKDYKKCLETCDAILERLPQHRNALLLSALAYDESGETETAAYAYEKALSIYGTSTELTFNLGLCYFSLKRYQSAITVFNRVYASNPNRADIPYLIGECYYGLYEYETAANYFESARAIDPTYGDSKKYLIVIDEILERGE